MRRLKRVSNIRENEKIMLHLPEKCDCHACRAIKSSVKKDVGEKRFKEVLNLIALSR